MLNIKVEYDEYIPIAPYTDPEWQKYRIERRTGTLLQFVADERGIWGMVQYGDSFVKLLYYDLTVVGE